MADEEFSPEEIIAQNVADAVEFAAPPDPGNPNQPYADPRPGAALIGPGPQPYPPGQEPRPGSDTGGQGRAQEPITLEDFEAMQEGDA